jgi:hypothetical protein
MVRSIYFSIRAALLHKYLKPLCSKDRQLESLIEKSLRSKAFGRNTE